MSLIRLLSLIVPVLFFTAPPAHAHYERGELEQMLAPIALYPDSVLSHVLIAATYPDQVAEAARWSRRHPDLQGEAAVDAVEEHDWDASVKALVAFPEVLARMDEDPDWTDQLGEAFLDQEGEVMDAVQHLRTRAYEAGRLGTLDNVRVVREREYIYIEPAVRGVIFVPYYDPFWVYGTWWWPHYPPYCWTTWYGRPVSYYGRSWYWGVGFHVRPAFYFTTFHWPARHVVVTHRYDRPLYSGRDAPRHREVRHWRQEPSARRHAERNPGANRPGTDRREPGTDRREPGTDRREPGAGREDRRPERGVERHPDRRDDRRDERRNERRHGGRGDERRDERQERGREPAASPNRERPDETRGDDRRERRERGRQRRDAEREAPAEMKDAQVRGAPERRERHPSPGQGRREARGEQPRSAPPQPQREQREEARPTHREDSQPGRREEAPPSRREEAEPSRREEAQQQRREENRGERDSGRQKRDDSERGRSQREERSRR